MKQLFLHEQRASLSIVAVFHADEISLGHIVSFAGESVEKIVENRTKNLLLSNNSKYLYIM